MREHDYLMQNSHAYSESQKLVESYRKKYYSMRDKVTEMRLVVREYFAQNPDAVPSEEIKKLAGIK